ncbi:carbonic anhydrase [Actinacidiphila sp. DG2A-62]|uniref:carbonic anhydrase n=1 Tax=Actinacidiphila sp. DG2A-62 TaxID=3108821 RepID=UPI002DB86056|nr:carbonic anhydrase [Actinacidiphila sp. DG2A-62]MEC3992133.1 carbonic anhydrase [Actinacidiphila sp. DG2A-62]
MNNVTKLLDNNARFAMTDAKDKVPAIPFIPNKQVYVLTCIDPRVDPAATMGLDLGDAIVARTVGGRANRSFLDDLAWISYLHETMTPDAEWFEIAVVHHTDCGSALMADPALRKGFVELGFDDEEIRRTAVVDPATTVPVDVRAIIDEPTVSGRIKVSGYRYDVKTGRIEQVVAPRSRDGG